MKLRTSFFNPTAFKKDVTRFAPAWVLYTVGLFMVLSACVMDNAGYYKASNLADSLIFMVAINLCYGLLNGQLLFGDLFNARHCNALHAMPLRRECWFVTHVVSGLVFALVPNLLMSLVAMLMLGHGWSVALWWLLAVTLQYLFFFGLAVFSALCVGNRFAMVLVYGIINFFSLIVYWFYYSIYQPMLYGVIVSEEPFLLFCPVWQLMENFELIDVIPTQAEAYSNRQVASVAPGEGWGYLAICAAIGVALIAVALLLYRRRKLESAGDFMAVKALEPVFLVLYTLCMAAFFQVFANLFGTEENAFLALGFVIGFFTGRMLLMRTTKVFQPRSFLWFGILAAAFILSMVLTWLDPLGVTRYIPDAGAISKVKLSDSYTPQYGDEPYLTEESDIETIRQLHQMILDGQINPDVEDDTMSYQTMSLCYVLNNGVTVIRQYDVECGSPVGLLAQEFYTRSDFVLGTDDADAFVKGVESVQYNPYQSGVYGILDVDRTNEEYIRGLVETILADCAEGTMAQSDGYHEGEENVAWIDFIRLEPMPIANDGHVVEYSSVVSVMVYESNRHTVAYLEENPFPVEEVYG